MWIKIRTQTFDIEIIKVCLNNLMMTKGFYVPEIIFIIFFTDLAIPFNFIILTYSWTSNMNWWFLLLINLDPITISSNLISVKQKSLICILIILYNFRFKIAVYATTKTLLKIIVFVYLRIKWNHLMLTEKYLL